MYDSRYNEIHADKGEKRRERKRERGEGREESAQPCSSRYN
jgi:hypothetical protein